MIDAEKRSLLTDALTPPPGYRFDTGIATTYSLDLVTLLALPLHLSWLASGEENSQQIEPIRLIEALRRTADRLTVFCERGRMLVPRMPSPLLALLEAMVHEVKAPHGGAFHPKVWLLRFVSADQDAQIQLRLLVMSRNLTDDASWDLTLQMDGKPGLKRLARNRPLAVFFESIAVQSRKALTADRHSQQSSLIEHVRQCVWELPAGFEDIRFHDLGLKKKPFEWFPKLHDRLWDELGVISPFVSERALQALARATKARRFLISRPTELDALTEPLPGEFSPVMMLSDHAEYGDNEDDTLGKLNGLHAKVFVARQGWNTHLFLGSANATDAALLYGRNVELMVELIGKHSKVGTPDSWLGEKGLQHLLKPYERSPFAPTEETINARKTLDALHKEISNRVLEIRCETVGDNWTLILSGLESLDMREAHMAVWPLTLNSERAVVFTPENCNTPVKMGVVSKQEITSFVGFLLKLGDEELRFGLDIPLLNPPEGRDLEILRQALKNREGFVRYLVLLLGDWTPAGANATSSAEGAQGWGGVGQTKDVPLFEMLARAYAREPERLKQVATVVARLRNEGVVETADVLPPAFMAVWECFETAMKRKETR